MPYNVPEVFIQLKCGVLGDFLFWSSDTGSLASDKVVTETGILSVAFGFLYLQLRKSEASKAKAPKQLNGYPRPFLSSITQPVIQKGKNVSLLLKAVMTKHSL